MTSWRPVRRCRDWFPPGSVPSGACAMAKTSQPVQTLADVVPACAAIAGDEDAAVNLVVDHASIEPRRIASVHKQRLHLAPGKALVGRNKRGRRVAAQKHPAAIGGQSTCFVSCGIHKTSFTITSGPVMRLKVLPPFTVLYSPRWCRHRRSRGSPGPASARAFSARWTECPGSCGTIRRRSRSCRCRCTR